jgi:hypothetical protein
MSNLSEERWSWKVTTSDWSHHDMLADLGEVCVHATWLEYSLVELASLLGGHDDEWAAKKMAKPGGPLAAISEAVAAETIPGLYLPSVRSFVERAKACLEERNKAVHSVALTTEDGRIAAWWHARSNEQRPVSKEELADVTKDLWNCYIECQIFIGKLRT